METFQRFEKKYLLNDEQYASLMEQMKEHIVPDRFYQTMIRSLYYDTDDHELVRRSIEKPEYKEKLRARSYGDSKGNDEVFVELKKKYDKKPWQKNGSGSLDSNNAYVCRGTYSFCRSS